MAAGQCQTLFANQNRTVDIAMQYLLPNAQTQNNYTIGGNVIANNLSGAPSIQYTPLSLAFGANGKATLPNNIYNDAGQVQLLARYIEPANLADSAWLYFTGEYWGILGKARQVRYQCE